LLTNCVERFQSSCVGEMLSAFIPPGWPEEFLGPWRAPRWGPLFPIRLKMPASRRHDARRLEDLVEIADRAHGVPQAQGRI
jgi:hypothetical protein